MFLKICKMLVIRIVTVGGEEGVSRGGRGDDEGGFG